MADVLRPDELAATDRETGRVNVVIETPRNSRCKFKFDEKHGLFQLHKLLPLGAAFPHAFGFIPSTRAEDGDPLDVLVLLEEPLFTGCVAQVRLVGVLEAEQTVEGKTTENDRLIGVIETAINPAELTSLDELGPIHLQEIEHFFVSYNEAEGRQFRPLRRGGPERASQLLEEGRRRHEISNGRSGPNGRSDDSAHDQAPPAAPPKPKDIQEQKKPKSQKPKSYQLRPEESLRKGIKRIVRHQLDKANDQVKKFQSPGESGDVHDIRKRFKRVRAIVRLVRSELGEGTYQGANRAIRDAGQIVSPVRNGKAALDTLAALQERSDGVSSEPFDVVGRFLRAKQWDARDLLVNDRRGLDALRKAIEESRKHVSEWSLPRQARRPACRGLTAAYKKACRAFAAAQSAATDDRLHELRKQAKYFYHELQTVALLGPATNKALEEGFHELEQTLGEDHDLAMLHREATACQKGGLTEGASKLIALIDKRRRELQEQAMRGARQFFRNQTTPVPKLISTWSKRVGKAG